MPDRTDDEALLEEHSHRLVEVVDWWAPQTLSTFGAVALGLGVVAAALVHIVVLRILDLDLAAISWGEEMSAVFLIGLLFLPFVMPLYDLTKTPETRRKAVAASVAAVAKTSGFKQFAMGFVQIILVWLPVYALRYTAFAVPLEGTVFIHVGAAMMGAAFGQMLMPRFLLRWGRLKAPGPS